MPRRVAVASLTGLALLAGPGCDRLLRLGEVDGDHLDAGRDGSILVGRPDGVVAGHDEDDDTIDDAIDNCPAIPNKEQEDLDGDNVGEVCDPHPTLAVDRIRYFDTLESFSAWSITTGQWSLDGDSVTQSEYGEDLAVFALADSFIEPTISVTMTVMEGYGGGAYIITGDPAFDSGPPGMMCYFNRNAEPDGLTLWVERAVLGAGIEWTQTLDGTEYPFTLTIQSSTETKVDTSGAVLCTGTRGGTTVITGNPEDATPIASAKVGLYTYGAMTTFSSATIFDVRK